jgi:hypothetical protein
MEILADLKRRKAG